jgi:hypothetical protein
VYRVENQFIATVGVLLPPGNFVIDGEGDTFLEFISMIGCKTDLETLDLESK